MYPHIHLELHSDGHNWLEVTYIIPTQRLQVPIICVSWLKNIIPDLDFGKVLSTWTLWATYTPDTAKTTASGHSPADTILGQRGQLEEEPGRLAHGRCLVTAHASVYT